MDRGGDSRAAGAGTRDWDTLSKGVFLVGSLLLFGIMAVGFDDRERVPRIDPLKPSRGPPPSYRPSPAQGDSQCCSICLSNARDTLIEDCLHLVMCWDCYEHLFEKKCPACMHPITCATYVYSP